MKFRDREKQRYLEIKPILFSAQAQSYGNYNDKPRSFCLADDCASENIFADFRTAAIRYFDARKITWHDGLEKARIPSNHLCCSQSCCVNFFFQMANDRALLEDVLRIFYPDLVEALPIYCDDPLPDGSFPYVAFEWIGSLDFLQESKRKDAKRTRGKNFTSADFVFRFRRADGRVQLVLGEWKYTEEYGVSDKGIPARKANYIRAFNRRGGAFAELGDDFYSALFYEPFYQLMRLQLMAQEMESGEFGLEMDAEVVSVLHISPNVNSEFRNRTTSPYLKRRFKGQGPIEIWEDLDLAGRFLSIGVEDLMDAIVECDSAETRWTEYLTTRYSWPREI